MTAPITYDPVNNVRFLVRRVAQRPNLASKALAHSVKALASPWREHFGYEPLLCETFTDIESHEGPCYKAGAAKTPAGCATPTPPAPPPCCAPPCWPRCAPLATRA